MLNISKCIKSTICRIKHSKLKRVAMSGPMHTCGTSQWIFVDRWEMTWTFRISGPGSLSSIHQYKT